MALAIFLSQKSFFKWLHYYLVKIWQKWSNYAKTIIDRIYEYPLDHPLEFLSFYYSQEWLDHNTSKKLPRPFSWTNLAKPFFGSINGSPSEERTVTLKPKYYDFKFQKGSHAYVYIMHCIMYILCIIMRDDLKNKKN